MTSGAAPVSSTNLASLVPAAGASGSPQVSQMIRAVVMAQLADGLMTLSTASGTIQARSDRALPKGTPVEVTLSEEPDGPGLVFTVRTAKTASSAAPSAVDVQAAVRTQAVAVASQASVQRQDGIGPLLADLSQADGANALPQAVRAAAAPILARALPSGVPPAPAQIRQAAESSGLFLESNLAAVARPPAADLKAALLVLGQVLRTWQAATQTAPAEATPPRPPAAAGAATPQSLPTLAPSSGPAPGPALSSRPAPNAATPAALQALAAEFAADLPLASERRVRDVTATPATIAAPPAPPYRGGPVAPQAAAAATLAPDAPAADLVRRLAQQTTGALARQEMLQIASLPESIVTPAAPRPGPPAPGELQPQPQPAARWHFEIPFATPQGPVIAQFEISRDGQGTASGGAAPAAEPVWRTRFSIDIEPVGPVHVQLALAGAQAHVALWAERPEGLERLRGQADLLSRALAAADCVAEVSFHAGAPFQPPPAAGRFVDVAS